MTDKKKNDFLDKAMATMGEIGSKVGSSINDIKEQATPAAEKLAGEVKKQSQKAMDTLQEKAQAAKEAKEKRDREKHTVVQLKGSEIKILIPDGYTKLQNKNPIKAAAQNIANEDAAFQKVTSNSNNVVVFFKTTPDKAMDPDNLQGIIDGIHEVHDDNQGLVEARNGETKRGYKYIYSIVKTHMEESMGFRYFIRLNLVNSSDIIEINADFIEIGTTGGREAICMDLARRAELMNWSENGFEGWFKDPYDPEHSRGSLKSLAEMEGIDGFFPDHPLTQAHELLYAVLNDEFVTVRSETAKDADDSEESTDKEKEPERTEEEKKEEEKEFLLGLFVDECRRYTYPVEIEKEKKAKDIKREKKGMAAEEESTEESERTEENNGKEKKVKDSLDDKLRRAIDEYNAAYTLMSDKGTNLYIQRERSIDLMQNVENLINSIANHPKSFDADISEIVTMHQNFKKVCEYAKQELEAAQKSAMSAGAGLAGGAAVASLAPSAAMWVATTFGTASTGTAISTLSGAAATKAALAWLGGGALSAGGGGIAAGNALLALAGPVGWGLAGATLLASIALFTNKKIRLEKQKKEEIESVLRNTESLKEVDEKIKSLLDQTESLRDSVNAQYGKCLSSFEKDFTSISEESQMALGTLVNETKALAALLEKGV
ncbi:hypothetical protein [Butyrivibrio sp. INlla16]|uniref:hypothetical protein n=1 Tax=Butyrivibrio sp. INlla16 TaxID=1520807 RepID=UPI00087E20B3|nr:hypothetical protein [Butyrivibrio sp. INlla16]SDB54284.1 hypothetical protein SAMN02910263_02756 [Butyrivibrio sp. INlla16]